MIESDYVMRMLTVLARFLARVLFLKRSKEFPVALTELAEAGRTLVGVDGEMVRLLSAEQLMALFGRDASVAVPKSYVLGALLKEEGEILKLTGREEESHALLTKSAYLLVETYLQAGGRMEEAHETHIADVLRLLGENFLSVQLHRLLIRYYEIQGRFDLAENVLFELLGADPSSAALGVAFYGRLLEKTDAELAAGGLPRDEVEEGRAEVERLQRTTT